MNTVGKVKPQYAFIRVTFGLNLNLKETYFGTNGYFIRDLWCIAGDTR